MTDLRAEVLFAQTMNATIAEKDGLCDVSVEADEWRTAFSHAIERFVDQAAPSLRDAENRMRDEMFDFYLLVRSAREGSAYSSVDLSIWGNEIRDILKIHPGDDEYLGLDPSKWSDEEREQRQRLDKKHQRLAAAIVDHIGEAEIRDRIADRHAYLTAISCLRRLKNYGLSTKEIRRCISATTRVHPKTSANIQSTEDALVQVLFQHDDSGNLVFPTWGEDAAKKPILKSDWTTPRKKPFTHVTHLFERIAEIMEKTPSAVSKSVLRWDEERVGPFPKGDDRGKLDAWIRCGEEIVGRTQGKL